MVLTLDTRGRKHASDRVWEVDSRLDRRRLRPAISSRSLLLHHHHQTVPHKLRTVGTFAGRGLYTGPCRITTHYHVCANQSRLMDLVL